MSFACACRMQDLYSDGMNSFLVIGYGYLGSSFIALELYITVCRCSGEQSR